MTWQLAVAAYVSASVVLAVLLGAAIRAARARAADEDPNYLELACDGDDCSSRVATSRPEVWDADDPDAAARALLGQKFGWTSVTADGRTFDYCRRHSTLKDAT